VWLSTSMIYRSPKFWDVLQRLTCEMLDSEATDYQLMNDYFDGELPHEIINEYPTEDVEALGVIDLSRGVPPLHIHSRHVRLRLSLRTIARLFGIVALMVIIGWNVPIIAFCMVIIIGISIFLIVLEGYFARWQLKQRPQGAWEDDDIWWLH
jgi:hypothetical protein